MLSIPPLALATFWLAVVLALMAGCFLLVRKWAGRSGDSSQEASEMLTKFRHLHARGGLSDEEYRTIKGKLAPELQAIEATSTSAKSEEASLSSID